uniref:FYVE-type domain-containing protein n=2 Tax=Caenorhabditis japonica TaxID=281687 RepID=A0A8R1DK94_CAEJA
MEEVPDMDDLLDEMESDLIRKARSSQPLPLLPPTSIGMQPRGFHQNPPDAVIVSKYVPNEDMNEQLEGHIEIDTSKLPNIFKPKNVIWQKQESNSNETTPMFPTKTNGTHQAEVQPEIEKEVVKVVQSEPEPEELEPEPEPEYVSEAEEDEDTIVPETQIISSFNVTDRDLTAQVVQKPDKEQLDTEMESMLEYLNGFGNSAVETVIENEAARKPGGRESLSESADESIISQFADTLSEELMESALKQPIKNLHYDPAIKEFYTANDSAPDVFAISLDETQSSSSCDNLSEPESFEKEKDRMPSIDEDEVEEVCGNVSENKEKESEAAIEDDVVEEEKTEPEVSDIEIATTETVEPVLEEVTVESEVQREEENVEKIVGSDIVEPAVVEAVRRESDDFTVDIVPVDHEESSIEPCEEEQSRPRIDSSIATIHVLHESDSDDATTPRRERRLTESELQLGKSSPYWIPDSESPLCMLCNSKFTIITRRHHCRACGRVLCGSCCNEKAILEYLQEEGKKPQAVRVCQPCSAMLARIEAHEHEEKRRRESVTSESDVNHLEDSTSALLPSSVPRGVLKTRSMTQGNDEEGTSTSSQTTSVSGVSTESSKRSVMFRDGVRPGAQGEEANPEDEKSTALKPKKKSRKRQSVVKRIAELKMEDELHSVLPEDGKTRVQILKPGADFPVYENASDVLESLCNFSIVTIMLKRNLSCTVQIFNNPNFGLVWAVSSQGFAQIGLDELLFSWTLNDREKQRVDADEPELDENNASSYIPFSVLRRIALIFKHSTEHEFAGVRRVGSRLAPVHSDATPEYPLTRNVLFFRPTVQVGLANMRIPTNPFLIACFLHDDELHWSTGLSNRLLYKLGEKYNVFPTPFVNEIGREALYNTDFSGTVLKVFTDFRNWSYRMRHIPGCTVSLTNEKTVIRVPKSALTDFNGAHLHFSRMDNIRTRKERVLIKMPYFL